MRWLVATHPCVNRAEPQSGEGKEREEKAVLRVLQKAAKVSLSKLRSDDNLLRAVRHMIFHVREGQSEQIMEMQWSRGPIFERLIPYKTLSRIFFFASAFCIECCDTLLSGNGLASIFDALSSDAVFVVANSILYVLGSLGFTKGMGLGYATGLSFVQGCKRAAMAVQGLAGLPSLLPTGILGIFVHSFLKMFNLILFPQLVALTSGLALALGVACLLQIPLLFSKVDKYLPKLLAKGSQAVFKNIQSRIAYSACLGPQSISLQ